MEQSSDQFLAFNAPSKAEKRLFSNLGLVKFLSRL